MSEGLEKKRQELKRQISNKVQTIPDLKYAEKALSYLTSPKKWSLIEGVTSLPSNTKIENHRMVICFDYFNWNTCCFEQFNPAKGKKLLEIFEQVAKCEVNKFPELKLGRDSVGRGGIYDSLFSTVTPDVTKIEETEFCDGRVFYLITEPNFHIISVETKHRNLG